jgi:hypothetical protein
MTAIASYLVQVGTLFQGWPLWAVVVAGLVPWLLIFSRQVAWTYQHYPFLALFYVLAVTQTGHLLEHVAQMVQIHLLGLTGPNAQGVISVLNVEWVHFVWNT